MKRGDVIMATTITAVAGRNRFTFKADGGQRMVFLFLGTESDEQPLGAEAVLRAMGWERKEEK